MSSANVKAIEALEALRSALLQFKSDGTNSLEAIRAESRRTIAWLEERQRHWQREQQHRSEKLRQARAALSACQREPGDCSHEATMVQRAQRDVQEAEQRLATVRLHLKRVIQAHEEYEREARRLINMFGQELLQGTTLLKTSFTSLSSYAGGGNQATWVEMGGSLAGAITHGPGLAPDGGNGKNENLTKLQKEIEPTLQRIERGEKHPHPRDGTPFKNKEEHLAVHSDPNYYTEYVHPTKYISHAGLQRIVLGRNGEIYYTSDHYNTFIRLQ